VGKVSIITEGLPTAAHANGNMDEFGGAATRLVREQAGIGAHILSSSEERSEP